MKFYSVDVKSVKYVNGKKVAFDYINTILNKDKALQEAERLSKRKDTVAVSVHEWILEEDGTQKHSEDCDSILFSYNKPVKEWCIVTADYLTGELEYLAWQKPEYEDTGYFWTSRDVFEALKAKNNTVEHPFIFSSMLEGIKFLRMQKIPQQCSVVLI